MFHFWIIWKYLRGGGRFIGLTSLLAVLGLALAVGCLILSMSVVSGVESHLKKVIIDVNGHFMMMKPSGPIKNPPQLQKTLHEILPELKNISPFVHAEGLAASKGVLSGVIVHGLNPKTYQHILHLKNRIIKGQLTLTENSSQDEIGTALLGKNLADQLNLKIGDEFQIIVPKPNLTNEKSFSPKISSFYLSGILDMGKYDYNTRFVFIQDKHLQKLKGWKSKMYSGLRMNFHSDEAARQATLKIGEHLGYDYYMRDWHSSNYVFFSEVAVQKWVIFIVLLFIVIVACFNVCSTLFVHVLKRFADISILQTLGANKSFLINLFITYGLTIGLIGSLLGLCLGWALCQIVKYSSFIYVPSQIYQFDHLPVEMRFMDIFIILGTTLITCLLSTLLPALKGSKINPTQGLRYE